MKITILGAGSAYGCPMCFNKWNLANPHNPKNERTRASILWEIGGKTFLVDVGPEFRLQMNRNKIENIDAVLLTHGHYDHIGGVPELPRASQLLGHPLEIWASKETMAELQSSYGYLFRGEEPEGEGLRWKILPDLGAVQIQGVNFETFQVPHHHLHCSAFRCQNVAYVTDWELLPDEAIARLKGLDLLVIECNNGIYPQQNGHSDVDKIKQYAAMLQPRKVVLTHLSARVDYDAVSALIPENWRLSYDGLVLEI